MSIQANPFVVILDANVLFPFRSRDILLTCALLGLFRARWTERIIEEWVSNLLRLKPHLADSVNEQVQAMHEQFEACFVTGYEGIIEGLELPDKNDRHVLAAAIRCSAQLIVTHNHKDFPAEVLDKFGIETIGVDEFLLSNFELSPGSMLQALKTVRQRYRKPSMTGSEFALDLTASGMPKLAAAIRPHREFL